jgi:hypothetical protein
MRIGHLPAAAILALACSTAGLAAMAQRADVEIGTLTCTLAEAGDAPASEAAAAAGQTRDAVCSFRPRTGGEEIYAGLMQGVSLSPDRKGAVIWLVKGAPGVSLSVGLLEQTFAADPKTASDTTGPMIGEANADIALHSMADKAEGSASAAEKPRPTGFVITGVELKLKSAVG